MNIHFNSNIAKFLIQNIPYFRGYTFLISGVLNILPISSIVNIEINSDIIHLDAKYRSQLAIIKNSSFEKGLLNFYLKNIAKGDVIFDIGSNWGYFTTLFSRLVTSTGKVVSVEANYQTFRILLNTVRRHSLINVTPYYNAISDNSGQLVQLKLPWYKNDTGGFIERVDSGSILTQTLDNIWFLTGKQQIKCVKMDIEGFEPLAIRGGYEFLKNGVTDFVLVEISSWSERRCGISHKEIFTEMRELGFKHIYFAENEDSFREVGKDEIKVDCNVLFAKSKPKL
jgi:FkbM family methyltransferase